MSWNIICGGGLEEIVDLLVAALGWPDEIFIQHFVFGTLQDGLLMSTRTRGGVCCADFTEWEEAVAVCEVRAGILFFGLRTAGNLKHFTCNFGLTLQRLGAINRSIDMGHGGE
eukprot:5926988-Amphidinium_carterae.1